MSAMSIPPGAKALAFGLALVVAGLLLGACEKDPPPAGAQPGIWLLLLPPMPLNVPEPGGPLRAIDLVSGRERTFGEPRQYVRASWSPDGSRVAALSLSTGESAKEPVAVHLFAADGKLLHSQPVDPLSGPALAWSPDSTRLALVGPSGIDMLDRDGARLGGVRATPLASGGFGGSIGSWSEAWSPGSGHLAIISNGLLVVANRDGKGFEWDLPPARSEFQMVVLGWKSGECVSLLERTPDLPDIEHVGCVGGSSVTWKAPEPIDISGIFTPPPGEANTLLPGMTWTSSRATADGTGDTWVLQTRPDQTHPLRDITLAVNAGGTRTLVTVGNALRGMEFDVVVVPGWPGAPPATRDLSAGRVSPWPLPRPSVSPEPPFTPQPVASAIPYPTPRGERVQPLVAGVPVFPGAVEIDGFTAIRSGATVAVQQFATDASGDQVIAFFEAELTRQGYTGAGGGSGVTGETRDFLRGRDRVQISTEYIPRPGQERASSELPYGYEGKAVPFLAGANGKTWFFVVTLHAP